MTRREFAIFAGGAAVLPARAEPNQTRGGRVVKDALEALGGEKFRNLRNVVETGRVYGFSHGQLSGFAVARIYTRFLDERGKPDAAFTQIQERVSIGKKDEEYAYLYTGGEGYEVTFRGVRRMEPLKAELALENKRRDALTILRLRLDEPGMYIQSLGSDIVDNKPVEIVEFADSENRATVVHFSRNTKLPIRATYSWREELTNLPNEETIYYSKYREVDGVNWPRAVQRHRNDRKQYEKYAETVEVNAELAESLFTILPGTEVMEPV